MTSSAIIQKISALIRSVSGESERERQAERAQELNIPSEISETKKAEMVLFFDAAMSGKTISMQDDSIGVPEEVLWDDAGKGEVPKRYSVWPNKPGEKKIVGAEHMVVRVIEALPVEPGIAMNRKRLVSVRPISNDDRLNCFYASHKGLEAGA